MKLIRDDFTHKAIRRIGFIFLLFLCVGAATMPTVYYVDPGYTGATQDGSAAHPWVQLGSAQWASINAALGVQDLTVYFSARTAVKDTDQVYGGPSEIDLNQRTAVSAFTLTLDGHSKFNANASAPAWQDYAGSSKCLVRDFYSQNGQHTKRSNITIDGFRIGMNAGGKAVAICGDNWHLRNCDIYHCPGVNNGPLICIIPTSDAEHEGSSEYCAACSSIVIENNKIHDSQGELIYVGGGGCSTTDTTGTSACMGFPSHRFITIQNNELYNGGVYGGQGDGIDVKGGIANLKIIGNHIHNLSDPLSSGIRAIVEQGARDGDPNQNNLIASNYISDITAEDAAISLVDSWGTPRGVEVRNNVITNSTTAGIKVYSGSALSLYNNTIYKSGDVGIVIKGGTVSVINNLLFNNNTGGAQNSFSGAVSSSNNAYSGSWSGTCTACVPGITAADLVDPVNSDFHLSAASKAKDAGMTLSSFNDDIEGTLRPQGLAWDIGAYELKIAGAVALASPIPHDVALKITLPNAFNAFAVITVDGSKLQQKGAIRISIYGADGRCVANGAISGSRYFWDTRKFSNGVYLVKVECGKQIFSQRVLLSR